MKTNTLKERLYTATDAHGSSSAKPKNELELLKLSVPAEPQYVSFVRHGVQDVLEQFLPNNEAIPDIMLAVGEACSNAVLYKHTSRSALLNISCRIVQRSAKPSDYECLIIDVRNTGVAFSRSAQKKSFDMPRAEQLDDHGRGMPLMQMLVDQVEVISDQDDTVVRLIKLL